MGVHFQRGFSIVMLINMKALVRFPSCFASLILYLSYIYPLSFPYARFCFEMLFFLTLSVVESHFLVDGWVYFYCRSCL
jgi:hypothetical protein